MIAKQHRGSRKYVGTVSVRGQVTVPADIRRALGVLDGGKVTFVIREGGAVELKVPEFPNVESLRGQRAKLRWPRTRQEMLEVGREDGVRLPRG